MDILYELSCLLFQGSQSPKDPEHMNLKKLEQRLLAQISEAAGEDLKGKLTDVQEEIAYHDLLLCFLHGLRLGFAASELGQCP